MSDENDTGPNFDYLKMTQASLLAARLGAGEHVTKSEIAAFLLKAPPNDWPPVLTDHVIGLLEGNRKGPRGRPKKKYSAIDDARIQMFYPSVLSVLQGKTDGFPNEFVEGIQSLAETLDASLAPHEKAKSITSIFVFGQTGHEKTVQERCRAK